MSSFLVQKGRIMSQKINVLYQKKPFYDIVIERDFSTLSQELDFLALTNKKIAIITDTQVGPIYSQEIKDILHIPEGTVKSRLNKARNSIKDYLI